jgi:hypothetical protein
MWPPGGFHRDSAYLLERPSDALATILVQLDRTAPGRGCTRVCQGSHLRSFGAVSAGLCYALAWCVRMDQGGETEGVELSTLLHA